MNLLIILFAFTLPLFAQDEDALIDEALVRSKLKDLEAAPACEKWAQVNEWSDKIYQTFGVDKVKVHPTKRIKIAVIDTGINLKNPLLLNSIPKKFRNRLSDLDFTKKKLGLSATDAHGSHVAGIVLGIFPQAKILPLKYIDGIQNGEEDTKSFIKAVNFAINEKVDIINYSAGGNGYAREEEEILKTARAKGILVVVAAGNDGQNIEKKDTEYFPASLALSNMIIVGSHQTNLLTKSLYSNYGPNKVSLLAPGEKIVSFGLKECQLVKMSGTSMATPFVTATIALLKAKYPQASNEKIIEHLTSHTLMEEGVKVSKHGILNFKKLFESDLMEKNHSVATK